jgi:hypothetical protein
MSDVGVIGAILDERDRHFPFVGQRGVGIEVPCTQASPTILRWEQEVQSSFRLCGGNNLGRTPDSLEPSFLQRL